jgi:hypothetical protein
MPPVLSTYLLRNRLFILMLQAETKIDIHAIMAFSNGNLTKIGVPLRSPRSETTSPISILGEIYNCNCSLHSSVREKIISYAV